MLCVHCSYSNRVSFSWHFQVFYFVRNQKGINWKAVKIKHYNIRVFFCVKKTKNANNFQRKQQMVIHITRDFVAGYRINNKFIVNFLFNYIIYMYIFVSFFLLSIFLLTVINERTNAWMLKDLYSCSNHNITKYTPIDFLVYLIQIINM